MAQLSGGQGGHSPQVSLSKGAPSKKTENAKHLSQVAGSGIEIIYVDLRNPQRMGKEEVCFINNIYQGYQKALLFINNKALLVPFAV